MNQWTSMASSSAHQFVHTVHMSRNLVRSDSNHGFPINSDDAPKLPRMNP